VTSSWSFIRQSMFMFLKYYAEISITGTCIFTTTNSYLGEIQPRKSSKLFNMSVTSNRCIRWRKLLVPLSLFPLSHCFTS